MNFDFKTKILSVVLVTVLMIFLMFYALGWVITKGPSEAAKKAFVISMSDSTLTGFIPGLYLNAEEIDEILSENNDGENIITDSSLISIPESSTHSDLTQNDVFDPEFNGIELITLERNTYNASLMIVSDPKRIFIGTPDDDFGVGKSGETVYNMTRNNNAVAGINAAGLTSTNGGIPQGAIIKNGEVLWGKDDSDYYISGFDANGVLHVGKMTISQALDKGVINATTYGPSLIINGIPQLIAESLPAVRTAIGQRADGAVILLAVTAKNETAPGATYEDLIDIFTEYGAVNASNLYCGKTATMVLGEKNVSGESFATDYQVAAAFLVK